MTTFLGRSLRPIGTRRIVHLMTKWNVGPRYCITPSSGVKITNSFNLIMIGDFVVVSVIIYIVISSYY